MPKYTIKSDAPGHTAAEFKVFSQQPHVKVATLPFEAVWQAMVDHLHAEPPEGEPELHLLMVLSTGHIALDATQYLPAAIQDDQALGELVARLSDHEVPGCCVDSYYGGWHLSLGDEDPDDTWPDPSLQAVVSYARQRGATHLRLDRDGPIVKDLPTYNW